MGIHLYAEHLPNIRALSIQAALDTVANKQTKATLSADGSTLTLSHEDEIASIQLPVKITGGHNEATLAIPAAPTKDLSFRLKVEEQPAADGLLTGNSTNTENRMPWNANDLTDQSEMCCGFCSSILVARGSIKRWKDLPSEGWAEMMDFWHCHKPTEPHDKSGSESRGIGANSKLAIDSGVGLVGPLDIVFAAQDCSGITCKVSKQEQSHALCYSCRKTVGLRESADGSIRLRKQKIKISHETSAKPVGYAVEKWLAGHIIQNVEMQGIRKFTVSSPGADDNAISLWVFAPDLSISSSTWDGGQSSHRVAKIMWKNCEIQPAEPERLNTQNLLEDDIELPEDELEQLRTLLMTSESVLPPSGRKFQDWNVGILRRFCRHDYLH